MLGWINGEYFIMALAQWLACVTFITTYRKKVKTLKNVGISAAMFFVQIFFAWLLTKDLEMAAQESILIIELKSCLYIVLICLHIKLTCRLPLIPATIKSLFVFMVAELMKGMAMFGHYLVIINDGVLTPKIYWGIIAIVFVVILGIVFALEIWAFNKIENQTEKWTELLIAFIITVICVFLHNIVQLFMQGDLHALWDKTLGFIPRFTYVLIGLFVMYGIRIWKQYKYTRHELEMINGIIEKQRGQYEQAKVNSEMINQRYHDLKNQIAIIRSNISPEKQNEWLNALEKTVEQIEPERLTGNPVLDTILWEKNQYCTVNNIKMSYVMDGSIFEEIAADDLCVLFGGALDNAIEAVLKISDEERRLIHVRGAEQQGYIVVSVENINETPVEYADGNIITTKAEKDIHGYGIKGIKFIAEKYGGNINIIQEGDWFRLTVLLKKQV